MVKLKMIKFLCLIVQYKSKFLADKDDIIVLAAVALPIYTRLGTMDFWLKWINWI